MTTITRGFTPMGDRYRYDFKLCTPESGWAQLDTKQDASYYGNWVNPIKFAMASYCEGDTTYTECADRDEFIATLTETLQWHAERDYGPKIDGMCRPEIIAAFEALGFKEWLH